MPNPPKVTPNETGPATVAAIDCCPPLEPCTVCDVIEFPYRLPFRPVVKAHDQSQVVPVEVTLRYRLERCSKHLALGDILYSTTLLPGEQVRLFTSDRHTRFSFDSESKLSYRNNTTSEESTYMSGMANAMSNLNVVENDNRSQNFHESAAGGGGGGGIDLGFISFGGSASASSHDAQSTDAFAQQISQHADAYSHHVETATRAASSTQIGEVATRSHTQGESEDHFESSSRTFTNPNHCHALSFLFYRVDKCQTLTWTLVSIDLRVDDPVSPTGVALNPSPTLRQVNVIPDAVLSTATARPDVAQRALSAVAIEQTPGTASAATRAAFASSAQFATFTQLPIPVDLRTAALAQVTADLQKQGLLGSDGKVSPEAQARLGWTRDLSLPTPGVIVKACLDDCGACEPELQQSIQLDLTRKDLENKLLQRQIDLLDKAQEYRCCPPGAADAD
jgi:hypothetical protein